MLVNLVHKCVRFWVWVLIVAFVAPTTVKWVHEFEHNHVHTTETCDNHHQVHLHNVENDCDFCKVPFSKNDSLFTHISSVVLKRKVKTVITLVLYSYSYLYEQLAYQLRAPPF